MSCHRLLSETAALFAAKCSTAVYSSPCAPHCLLFSAGGAVFLWFLELLRQKYVPAVTANGPKPKQLKGETVRYGV